MPDSEELERRRVAYHTTASRPRAAASISSYQLPVYVPTATLDESSYQ